jgi:hypothetical protein
MCRTCNWAKCAEIVERWITGQKLDEMYVVVKVLHSLRRRRVVDRLLHDQGEQTSAGIAIVQQQQVLVASLHK